MRTFLCIFLLAVLSAATTSLANPVTAQSATSDFANVDAYINEAMRSLLPILQENCYRIYAPDTIGHPGKSAETRLSPKDDSYGQWLSDVMDGLGLDRAAFLGGSYGAGIILRLAAYCPRRITKMALFVPSGVVNVPLPSMMWRIGLPFLMYLLFPSQKHLVQAVRWMGDNIEADILELVKTVFEQVKVEAEMPRPVTKMELMNFHAPTLIVAAEKGICLSFLSADRRQVRWFIPMMNI